MCSIMAKVTLYSFFFQQYLRSTLSDRYKIFLDLFNMSTFLIPRYNSILFWTIQNFKKKKYLLTIFREEIPQLTEEMKIELRTHGNSG